jgi:hypothetical protein
MFKYLLPIICAILILLMACNNPVDDQKEEVFDDDTSIFGLWICTVNDSPGFLPCTYDTLYLDSTFKFHQKELLDWCPLCDTIPYYFESWGIFSITNDSIIRFSIDSARLCFENWIHGPCEFSDTTLFTTVRDIPYTFNNNDTLYLKIFTDLFNRPKISQDKYTFLRSNNSFRF